MHTVTETSARRMNGYLFLLVQFILVGLNAYLIYWMVVNHDVQGLWVEIPLFIYTILHMVGFFVVQPNEGRVLVLFGKYIGSVRDSGFFWANPFAIKKHISLRIRNFNSEKIKVNDKHGDPIEIAAVVV